MHTYLPTRVAAQTDSGGGASSRAVCRSSPVKPRLYAVIVRACDALAPEMPGSI
ncbi:hypothetical protein D9M68_239660 [compost metagenome]